MSTTESSRAFPSNDYPMVHNTYDSVQVGELESLIQVLQHKINTRDPQIKSVKYPNLLMSSLIELNYLVGMDRLKDSIALQVMRLIDGAKNGERSGRMLNTILYGPPGVGKTKVGIILAKIWYALGYLKRPKTGSNKGKYTPGTTTTTTFTGMDGGGPSINPLITIALLVLFYGFAYIVSGLSYVYNTWGWTWLAFIIVFTIVIVLFLYWNQNSYNYITKIVTNTEEPKEMAVDDKKLNQINDRDLIKVVSRQDFVAEYLGQTAPKTKALLYANLGKVLFIDEAYSLHNGERDQFGMEALTTLNLFMSEHPDGIAVIFAGYKDLMKYGVFRVQPGLPRRCMWHFECTGYDGEQLSDIFYRQVYKDGWAIRKSDYQGIRRLICDNSDMFKSYGGDTERLLFYSQLEASRTNMMSESCSRSDMSRSDMSRSDMSNSSSRSSRSREPRSQDTTTYSMSDSSRGNNDRIIGDGEYAGKVLTYEHVQHGLRRLHENNINES